MPSFDIVSKTELSEVDNALDGITREISTRFDFKDTKCSITRAEQIITIAADDKMRLAQIQDLLRVYFTRRKLDPGALDFSKTPEKASGDAVRHNITVLEGLDQTLAKKLVKEIKDAKLKVQASIQGDELRVTGKKRDDLQDAIAAIKALKIEQPLQFVNFRD